MRTTRALGSVVVHKHRLIGPREGLLTHLCIKTSLSSPRLLTLTVVGAPQMTVQQYLSIFPVFGCLQGISKLHSILSFFSLPLLLAPVTAPCRIVFVMPEDLEMSYHLCFCFFAMVRLNSGFCCAPPLSLHDFL